MSTIDIVLSIDTTGSMYPVAHELKRKLEVTVAQIFKDLGDSVRVGLIYHGDYCDAGQTYVTRHQPLTSNVDELMTFIRTTGQTGGGDAPECYELVMAEARERKDWQAEKRVLVIVGDSIPHGPREAQNYRHLDWRAELTKLQAVGIAVYGVQCLHRPYANDFYNEIARATGGFRLTLEQFSQINEVVAAICYKQSSDQQLSDYENRVRVAGLMTRGLANVFATLGNKATSDVVSYAAADLEAVPVGRFQVLNVETDPDKKDISIRDFVNRTGAGYKAGKGFYELTKPEDVQSYKEVVLVDRVTGDMFSGRKARELIGLGERNQKLKPGPGLDKYKVYIQSTSYNRKLLKGTTFLYEVEEVTL